MTFDDPDPNTDRDLVESETFARSGSGKIIPNPGIFDSEMNLK
jgi:hypothetical protein